MRRTRPAAVPGTCPRCTQPTLTGWDADTMGARATVTTTRLTTLGELQAWEAGLRTYDLEADRLAWRDRDAMTTRPPTTSHVLAAHRCGLHLDHHPPPATDEPAAWPGHPDQPPY